MSEKRKESLKLLKIIKKFTLNCESVKKRLGFRCVGVEIHKDLTP